MVQAASPELQTRRPLGLLVTPQGRLRVQHVSDSINDADGVDAEAVERIVAAFSDSDARGILHLATTEASTELPHSLAFGRRIGIEFLHSVCSLPERTSNTAIVRQLEVQEPIARAL